MKRGLLWLVDHSLGAFLGALIAIGVAAGVSALGDSPAYQDQLDAVLHAAARNHLTIASNREIDLRGTGGRARAMVFRPTGRDAYVSESDELRIYEERDGELKRTFLLRPVTHRPDIPIRINIVAIGKFGDSDQQQAIYRLDPSYADGRLPRPVAITFDPASETYKAIALLGRPRLARSPPGSFSASVRHLYQPTEVQVAEGRPIDAGGAGEIAVEHGHLAAAYSVRQRCNACPGTWEFKVYRLDFPPPRQYSFSPCILAFRDRTGDHPKLSRFGSLFKDHFLIPHVSLDRDSIRRGLEAALKRARC